MNTVVESTTNSNTRTDESRVIEINNGCKPADIFTKFPSVQVGPELVERTLMRASDLMLRTLIAVSLCAAAQALNNAPIIGILGVPAVEGGCVTVVDEQPNGGQASCFATVYAKWIEMAGGRVVPIPFNDNTSQLVELVSELNGVLFTGGGLSLAKSSVYYQTAHTIFEEVIKTNQRREYMPLWGTCMGFQLLNVRRFVPLSPLWCS